MPKFYYVVIDRDGGEVHYSEESFETVEEADREAQFWIDDLRYGSHEVREG